jgi:hypothetical protein
MSAATGTERSLLLLFKEHLIKIILNVKICTFKNYQSREFAGYWW